MLVNSRFTTGQFVEHDILGEFVFIWAGQPGNCPFRSCRVYWSVVGINNFLARRSDKKLGEDLRNNLVRLFSEHAANVVENKATEYLGPRSFDYAVATVATPDLDLRFVRVRGEFDVWISIPGPHRKWDGLGSALLWLDTQQGVEQKSEVPSWDYGLDWNTLNWCSVDEFLAENWDRLKAAASARPY